MRFGINSFLFVSPFVTQSSRLFSKFKKWGFDTVELPIEAPEHIDSVKVKKALDRAGLELGQMDLVELNEAFAAQSLAVLDELGLSHARVNLDGGAIALGHPLGASGARITGKAAALLQREGGRYALATMCIGGGQGIATVLEAA